MANRDHLKEYSQKVYKQQQSHWLKTVRKNPKGLVVAILFSVLLAYWIRYDAAKKVNWSKDYVELQQLIAKKSYTPALTLSHRMLKKNYSKSLNNMEIFLTRLAVLETLDALADHQKLFEFFQVEPIYDVKLGEDLVSVGQSKNLLKYINLAIRIISLDCARDLKNCSSSYDSWLKQWAKKLESSQYKGIFVEPRLELQKLAHRISNAAQIQK